MEGVGRTEPPPTPMAMPCNNGVCHWQMINETVCRLSKSAPTVYTTADQPPKVGQRCASATPLHNELPTSEFSTSRKQTSVVSDSLTQLIVFKNVERSLGAWLLAMDVAEQAASVIQAEIQVAEKASLEKDPK